MKNESNVMLLAAGELRVTLEKMDDHARYSELARREERGQLITKQWRLYMYYYERFVLDTPEEEMVRTIPTEWLERKEKRRGGCCNILPFKKKHTKGEL